MLTSWILTVEPSFIRFSFNPGPAILFLDHHRFITAFQEIERNCTRLSKLQDGDGQNTRQELHYSWKSRLRGATTACSAPLRYSRKLRICQCTCLRASHPVKVLKHQFKRHTSYNLSRLADSYSWWVLLNWSPTIIDHQNTFRNITTMFLIHELE